MAVFVRWLPSNPAPSPLSVHVSGGLVFSGLQSQEEAEPRRGLLLHRRLRGFWAVLPSSFALLDPFPLLSVREVSTEITGKLPPVSTAAPTEGGLGW